MSGNIGARNRALLCNPRLSGTWLDDLYEGTYQVAFTDTQLRALATILWANICGPMGSATPRGAAGVLGKLLVAQRLCDDGLVQCTGSFGLFLEATPEGERVDFRMAKASINANVITANVVVWAVLRDILDAMGDDYGLMGRGSARDVINNHAQGIPALTKPKRDGAVIWRKPWPH